MRLCSLERSGEKAAKDAGLNISVPFAGGRAHATQEQTDAESFEALEPRAEGSATISECVSTTPTEELLVDRSQLLDLTSPENDGACRRPEYSEPTPADRSTATPTYTSGS